GRGHLPPSARGNRGKAPGRASAGPIAPNSVAENIRSPDFPRPQHIADSPKNNSTRATGFAPHQIIDYFCNPRVNVPQHLPFG
ncbi:hypothetical protein, partial [Yinghuangia sp. YIM S10712]|uniref:hypothetical protein n=1 Tax=Yinghuangia sp. YIM S10712 TaxID=3436930 RepID=UPI003F52A80D